MSNGGGGEACNCMGIIEMSARVTKEALANSSRHHIYVLRRKNKYSYGSKIEIRFQ